MAIRNLDKIFRPQSVAVIGASEQASSVGTTVMRNLLDADFEGAIFPVNPKHESVFDRQAVGSVKDLQENVDLAVVCTPARTVPDIVRECGQAGIMGLVIISAGFRETGDEGKQLEAQIDEARREFDGMRIVGPNCLGVMAPHAKLNASFADAMPPAGRVAFISQSGALCTSVLDWAIKEGVGFSYFVSIGNMLDVSIGDLIDYCASGETTDAVILYVESIQGARQFMSAARAFAREKPIVAYKAGRFEESAQAAASHTGAMAGVDDVYQSAFNRAGIVRVFELDDLFDCAELLSRHPKPKGARLAIITNAGGPGVMATDALVQRDGKLADLSDETLGQLNDALPEAWSHGNPIDVLGDAPPERFRNTAGIVLEDEGVDAAVVILSPQPMTKPTEAAEAVVEAANHSRKPVLTAWMGADQVAEGIERLNEAGIPTYSSPEEAMRAFMYLASYARNRQVLYETPRDIPVEFALDRNKLRAVFNTILSEGHDVLSEGMSKALLEAYEIPVTKPQAAHSADDAVRLARRIGYPVAIKILSPDITHKTDVGGVELNVASDEKVTATFERMVDSVRQHKPDARIDGVTVQRMVSAPLGCEMIVGAKRDPVFGTVLMAGAGGTQAELFKDRALELPPLSERLARRMLESLQTWPLLAGYRGRPAMDIDRLLEILMRFSYLIADYPEIKELDVNPLLVTPDNVIALDARIVLDHEALIEPPRPYSHLAIRPYPEEFTRKAEMKEGREVLLRPIKPEDEPMWREMLDACSRESLWFRFRHIFKETTHEMAARFCFIDYDRELAIVAEIEEDGQRKLIGVGRLVAGADPRDAEYAVLVADAWQDQRLGSLLTDYCLEIAEQWGVERVWAETTMDNPRMISIFEDRGFTFGEADGDEVLLNKVFDDT
ncbi:MAG: bifunctional acetate--CoA ligase family protein/GNAT family N-acetyltransferase [Pirellulaceae bacterium]